MILFHGSIAFDNICNNTVEHNIRTALIPYSLNENIYVSVMAWLKIGREAEF